MLDEQINVWAKKRRIILGGSRVSRFEDLIRLRPGLPMRGESELYRMKRIELNRPLSQN